MRLVAWEEEDGHSTWGIVGEHDRVWDGGLHTTRSFREAQEDLLAAPDPGAWLKSLDLPKDPTQWDLMGSDLARGHRRLLLPWHPPEVWAAGVTYEISEAARLRESQGADFYARVYQAERPELFFKSAGDRVRGPGEAVGLRLDAAWQVPEPEVAIVVGTRGQILGVTCGNDMSCRDIEGQNPLYLPQAKIYNGSCALGPSVRLLWGDEVDKPRALSMRIQRGRDIVFEGHSSTSLLVRSFKEMVDWLGRAYSVHPGTVLLTGTAIVTPDDFTLRPGDVVRIWVEGVGELENLCETVGLPMT